jgi:hypothetical protein
MRLVRRHAGARRSSRIAARLLLRRAQDEGLPSAPRGRTGQAGRARDAFVAPPTANLGKSGGQPAAKRRAGGHSVNLAGQIEHELAPTKPPRRRLVHRSEQ